MNIKRWTSIKNGQVLVVRKIKIHNGGGNMEAVLIKENTPIIEEIEGFLGLNNRTPIIPSVSDLEDKIEKGDCFEEWYEEELTEIYNKYR